MGFWIKMSFKSWRNERWSDKADKIKTIAINKYKLGSKDDRDLVKGYFEIRSIKSQRLQQWLIIILTILLIYVTWKNTISCSGL